MHIEVLFRSKVFLKVGVNFFKTKNCPTLPENSPHFHILICPNAAIWLVNDFTQAKVCFAAEERFLREVTINFRMLNQTFGALTMLVMISRLQLLTQLKFVSV